MSETPEQGLPPEIMAQVEEGRRHPERDRPRPRRAPRTRLVTADEIHEQDMLDPEYRREIERTQAESDAEIAELLRQLHGEGPALASELATFEKHRASLCDLAQGKYVLMKNTSLHGVFGAEMDAIAAGYRKFGNVPFLVKRAVPVDEILRYRAHGAAMWRQEPGLMREIAGHVSGQEPLEMIPVDLGEL